MTERLLVVSPARDEAEFAERTLATMAAQTRPPDLWIVVDDGSSDATPAILESWRPRIPYLRVLRRERRTGRRVGPGVVEAFYAGLATVDLDSFDYVCKLDLDLALPPAYFEVMLEWMRSTPRLGTCSGKAYFPGPDGALVSEGIGDEMSLGMAKLYRRACFRQIGGFVREVMWDGIDCHRCRMLGWIAASRDDPRTRFTHLRPMGSSHQDLLTGRRRHGFGQYFMGTGPAFMTASAIFRMTRPPLVVGGLSMWWGYVASMLRRSPRLEDPEFRRFLRRCQRDMLLRGKKRAIAALDERGAAVWDPDAPPRWKDESMAAGPGASSAGGAP